MIVVARLVLAGRGGRRRGGAAVRGAGWVRGLRRRLAAGGIAMRGWRLMRTDSSPSEISSSEMPDSSSSSISFLTLRMSIPNPFE